MPPHDRPSRDKQVVNVSGHTVEVHLADSVVLLGPWESLTLTGRTATHVPGQVAELARLGRVELRATPAGSARPGHTRKASEKDAEQPPGRVGRTRGGA